MNRNNAQSLAEYAILISMVVTALVGIHTYVKRGLQAKYKSVVDLAGESVAIKQYEPYYVKTAQTIKQLHIPIYTYKPKGELTRAVDSNVTRKDATITQELNKGADDDWF